MEIINKKNTILTWDLQSYGLFRVVLWDGKITRIDMCRQGSSTDSDSLHAFEGSEGFLRHVHSALSELFTFLDKK